MKEEFSLHDSLRALPSPDGYYRGLAATFQNPPHNVLMFARHTSEEAMDGVLHLHPRFVFCWCVETCGNITVDGKMLSLSPDQGLLLFPFQQHYFSSFQDTDILWGFITFDLIAPPFLQPLRSNVVEIGQQACGQLQKVTQAFTTGDGCVTAWLEILLGGLASTIASRSATQEVPGAVDQRLRRVVRFVYQHLDRPLSVNDVAAVAHVSASHLRRLFRDRMGISLGRFLLQARLNHAQALLQTSDLPVGQIAEACGFASVYAFSRSFRNETGETPTALRRGVG